MSSLKAIISGGGTGGHIFPALAIANALKEIDPSSEILFVGAQGKMEMEKVPAAGYEIVGLPIRGLQRSLSLSNIKLPWLILKSLWISRKTIKKFNPDVVVGVGGYASAAIVYTASKLNIKTVVQEQNSYPGITNKILSKRADLICVAFEGMEKFFPKEKLLLTGNPIRQDITNSGINKNEAFNHFKLKSEKKTILAIGGSLGARTINQSMEKLSAELNSLNAQLLWQCGKGNYEEVKNTVSKFNNPAIHLLQFIQRMDLAYTTADLVISRAGALSICEITALKKPSVLIPLPTAAEDHQTKNAQSLVKNKAAILLEDKTASDQIVAVVNDLLKNPNKLSEMRENVSKVFTNTNAAADIANEIIKLTKSDV